MFQHAVITPKKVRTSSGRYINSYDLGKLAETIVFYDKVTVLGEPSAIADLIYSMGADAFLELDKSAHLSALPIYPMTNFQNLNGNVLFDPSSLSWETTPPHQLEYNLKLRKIKSQAILDVILKSNDYELINRDALKLAQIALQDQIAKDKSFVELLARSMVRSRNPGEDDKVRLVRDAESAQYGTGKLWIAGDLGHSAVINIDQSGNMYPRDSPSGSPLFAESLVTELSEFLAWFDAAMVIQAEFSVDSFLADTITSQIHQTTGRFVPDGHFAMFQLVEFNDARAIGAPILNAPSLQERHEAFMMLVKLIEKKKRFSDWLKKQSLDKQLIRSYYDHIRHGTWVDQQPGKMVRFFAFTGGGVIADIMITAATGTPGLGTAAGVALGAFDSLVLEHLRKGWRPTQFVDGPLTEWVKTAIKADAIQRGHEAPNK